MGPDIRKLLGDDEFFECLTPEFATAWDCMKAVILQFLGKKRAANYRVLVSDMLDAFDVCNINMSLKIHFLHHHMDFFENQLATESDEQGEQFHQRIKEMEARYNGKCLKSMMADFCWMNVNPN